MFTATIHVTYISIERWTSAACAIRGIHAPRVCNNCLVVFCVCVMCVMCVGCRVCRVRRVCAFVQVLFRFDWLCFVPNSKTIVYKQAAEGNEGKNAYALNNRNAETKIFIYLFFFCPFTYFAITIGRITCGVLCTYVDLDLLFSILL